MAGALGDNASATYRSGVDGLVLWAGGKKNKDKFISGEAGVINAGVCWLIDPAPSLSSGKQAGLRVSAVGGKPWQRKFGSGLPPCPGRVLGGCAPWHKHSPHQVPIPGGSAAPSSIT